MKFRPVRCFFSSLVLFTVAVSGSTVNAAALNLADAPLFLGTSVDPNIFYALDDSGSMDWEVMTSGYYPDYCYDRNHPGDASDDDCLTGSLMTDGLVTTASGASGARTFWYMFSNSDNLQTSSCNGGNNKNTIESCNADAASSNWINSYGWRAYSADFNVIYYNPEQPYSPWAGANMVDADFAAVGSYPQSGVPVYAATKNLGTIKNGFKFNAQDDNAGLSAANYNTGFLYTVWEDSHGFDNVSFNGAPERGSNIDRRVGKNGIADLWDNYTMFVVTATDVRWIKFEWAQWDGGAGTGGLKRVVVASGSFNGTDDTGFGINIDENKLPLSAAEIRQNIANWYQYGRRREFVAKGAIAALSMEPSFSNFRFGLSVLHRSSSLFVEMPASGVTDYSTHNEGLISSLVNFPLTWESTYLREGLHRSGQYYQGLLSGKSSPIIESCQQNFTVLFTDGYYNQSHSGTGDLDGDGQSNTLADIAKYFYDTDLSTLPNDVPVVGDDNQNQQHMVTFGAAFGVRGALVDIDGDGWPDPALAESDSWGSTATDQGKIDDMWHASYNSKGDFLSAATPAELVSGLTSIMHTIGDRQGAVASLSANTSSLHEGSRVYQASFHSAAWRGMLMSLEIDPETLTISSTPDWEAGQRLNALVSADSSGDGISDGHDSAREIITYRADTHKGIKFKFPSNYQTLTADDLSSSQVAVLIPNDIATVTTPEISENQAEGQKVVDYLRGQRDYEENYTASPVTASAREFRDRSSPLGDIADSSPVYVAAPNQFYSDAIEPGTGNEYSAFRAANADRQKVVYVGANDGMLHAFDVGKPTVPGTGDEILAYIPSAVYANLRALSAVPYSHKYFVNSTPVAADVFFASSMKKWRTVLIGGLGGGGQGIYALDITDPTQFKETNADNIVLWEFTDTNNASGKVDGSPGANGDPDLGYTFSRPAVGKFANDQWGVVFGNGYNNTTSPVPLSTTGHAYLYVVDVETGELIRKIDTGVGSVATPNGLASPELVDTDSDGIVDYVYAGDLRGNMWRFDLNNSDSSKWDVAFSGKPLFQTPIGISGERQPITVKPAVGPHPLGFGFLVYFGTGKYLEVSDNKSSGKDTQTFYAIWDDVTLAAPAVPVAATSLLEQEILMEVSAYGNDFRITSDYSIDWSNHRGWSMDMILGSDNEGEKIAVDALLRGNVIYFVSLVPKSEACEGEGYSWISELDASDGSRLSVSPIDVNGDKSITEADWVSYMGENVPISMWKTAGIVSTPTALAKPPDTSGDRECLDLILVQDSTGSSFGQIAAGNLCATGRRSWRQLR